MKSMELRERIRRMQETLKEIEQKENIAIGILLRKWYEGGKKEADYLALKEKVISILEGSD